MSRAEHASNLLHPEPCSVCVFLFAQDILAVSQQQSAEMLRALSSSGRALAVAERSPLPVCRQATSTHASTSPRNPVVQHPQPRQLRLLSSGKLQAVRSNRSVLAAAAEPLYDIYVKGAPVEGLVNEKGELGDCKSERSA